MRPFVLIVLLGALAAGACAKAGAKTQPSPPALDVPSPPDRVIVPPEPEPAQTQTTAPDPVPPTQTAIRSQRPPAKAELKVDPPHPDKKPEAPPVAEPAPPAGTLQQALPTAPAELEKLVRAQLSKARADLNGVDYKRLNADGRSQYDTAKRFIEQAEQALKENNPVFAAKVAEKAAGLATGLLGR